MMQVTKFLGGGAHPLHKPFYEYTAKTTRRSRRLHMPSSDIRILHRQAIDTTTHKTLPQSHYILSLDSGHDKNAYVLLSIAVPFPRAALCNPARGKRATGGVPTS